MVSFWVGSLDRTGLFAFNNSPLSYWCAGVFIWDLDGLMDNFTNRC